jgi:hypothetical protein
LIVSVVGFGIAFGWKCPSHKPGEMGLDELEFSREQRLLGYRHK